MKTDRCGLPRRLSLVSLPYFNRDHSRSLFGKVANADIRALFEWLIWQLSPKVMAADLTVYADCDIRKPPNVAPTGD